jgi:hypothetical protein
MYDYQISIDLNAQGFGLMPMDFGALDRRGRRVIKSSIKPIKWSFDLGQSVYFRYPNWDSDFLDIQDDDLYSSLCKFREYLRGYKDQNQKLFMKPDEIYWKSLLQGPAFTSELKKFRVDCFLKSFNGEYFAENERLNNTEIPEIIRDIGQVFNYYYLIFWEEEVTDFHECRNIKVSMDPEVLKRFEDTLDNYLKELDEITVIDERNILYAVSGSSTFSKKKLYSEKEKPHNREFAESIGLTQRCIIPVCAGNFRDAVLLDPRSLNTVQYIDMQVQEVLRQIPQYLPNHKDDSLNSVLDDLYYNHKFFIDRDFTKEGLTKPRQLLKVMLRSLRKRYPYCKAFSFENFYDSFSVREVEPENYDPKKDPEPEIYFPERGHGLGMANGLTSLMQVILARMIINELEVSEDENEVNIDYLFVNDDITIGLQSVEAIDSWYREETIIFKGLSLLRKDSKSRFTKSSFCVAENYMPRSLNRKEAYYRGAILQAQLYDIVTAKMYLSSLYQFPLELVEEYIEMIATKVGYEFFKDEYKYPTFCGGWYNVSLCNFSFDLLRLEKLEYSEKVYRAYRACKIDRPVLSYKRDKMDYKSPYLPIKDSIEEDVYEKFLLLKRYQVKDLFTKRSSIPKYRIEKFIEARSKKFFEHVSDCPDFYEFIKLIVKEHNNDFVPLKFMIDHFERPEKFYKLESLHNLYNPNAIIDYINRNRGLTKDTISIRTNVLSGKKRELNPTFRTTLLNRIGTSYFRYDIPKFDNSICETSLSVQSSYINFYIPQFMEEIYSDGIPVLKFEYRSELIKYKLETIKFKSIEQFQKGAKLSFSQFQLFSIIYEKFDDVEILQDVRMKDTEEEYQHDVEDVAIDSLSILERALIENQAFKSLMIEEEVEDQPVPIIEEEKLPEKPSREARLAKFIQSMTIAAQWGADIDETLDTFYNTNMTNDIQYKVISDDLREPPEGELDLLHERLHKLYCIITDIISPFEFNEELFESIRERKPEAQEHIHALCSVFQEVTQSFYLEELFFHIMFYERLSLDLALIKSRLPIIIDSVDDMPDYEEEPDWFTADD